MKLMSPHSLEMGPLEDGSQHLHYFELTPRGACLFADCRERASQEEEQHQLLQILLLPIPPSSISMLQGQRYILSQLSEEENERGNVHLHKASRRHRNRKNRSLWLFLCTKPYPSKSCPDNAPFSRALRGRTGLTGVLSCERSDAQPPSCGRRLLLGWSTALLSQLFIRCGGHQLSNKDSLQAAVINSLSQPSPAGKPTQGPAETRVSHMGR